LVIGGIVLKAKKPHKVVPTYLHGYSFQRLEDTITVTMASDQAALYDCIMTDERSLTDKVEIGDGGYGTVYRAKHSEWGPVAIKSLKNNANHSNG
jgi:hypothetical protein